MIINEGRPGKKLPTLTNPGVAGDLLSGKQLIGQDGNIITGTIPSKASTDISVSGRTVTVPAGYYPSQARKSIASATQATPSITVSSGGLITASATQSAGYVTSGTKSATKQLTTQAGKTVIPGTSQQTAVASGRYTTGTVYVAGDSDLKAENIKSGVSIFGVTGTLSMQNLSWYEFSETSRGTNWVTLTTNSSIPSGAILVGAYIYRSFFGIQDLTMRDDNIGIAYALIRGRYDGYDEGQHTLTIDLNYKWCNPLYNSNNVSFESSGNTITVNDAYEGHIPSISDTFEGYGFYVIP